MKTKVKRMSKRTLAVILGVIMLMSCLFVGQIQVNAYGGGTMYYTVTKDDNSKVDRSINYTISGNTAAISMNWTDAKVGSTVSCKLKMDNDWFGSGTLTQGGTGWMNKRDGEGTFSVTVTAKATVSFNILNIQPNDSPPNIQYSITDNVPDYYLVGSKWKNGDNWTLPVDSDHTRDLTYNSTTGLYEITLTSLASGDYTYRLRNKGRSAWNEGSNFGYSQLQKPITDASNLTNGATAAANDNNIDFTIKRDQDNNSINANVKIAFNEAASKLYMTVTPTSCDVTTGVTPSGVGTVTVKKHGSGDSPAASVSGLTPGATIDLVAKTNNENLYEFNKWSNSNFLAFADQNAATTTAVVSGTAQATAQFTKVKYDVNIGSHTNGNLTVDKSKCAWGDKVTITATPSEGYTLDSVTVTKSDTGTVTVTDSKFTMPVSNVTVSATFHQLNNYSVTYGDDGNGYVSVGYQYSDTQDTITQSITSGATDVVEGSAVNFCAIPKPGYKFDGWYTAASGGTSISTTQDETVTINGAVTRYAHFSALAYKPEANKIKLLISKSAVDSGTGHEGGNNNVHYWGAISGDKTIPKDTYYTNVNGAPTAADNFYLVTLDCSSDDKVGCLVNTAENEYTTKTADFGNLSKGNTYIINWSGDNTGGGQCVVLPAVYPITLNVTNAEMGEDTHVKAYAKAGTEVTVTATVADETNNKVTVKENNVVKADKKFTMPDNSATAKVTYAAKEKYTVTFTSNEGGKVTATAGGKAISSGDKVLEGTSVEFTATAVKNYIFDKWQDDTTTNPKSYTINADKAVTATFKGIAYQVVWGNGDKAADMKKLPNGTWISTTTLNDKYAFSIKRLSDNKFSHSGSDDYWLNKNSDDSTVSDKVNGRWYSAALNDKQLYSGHLGSAFYVVYDPNGICDRNQGSYDSSCHEGRLWVTTNEDGLYPATVYLKDGTVRSGTHCTSLNGQTTLVNDKYTTDGLTAVDVTGYGSKTVDRATEYFVKKVVVSTAKLRAGASLHIRTETNDNWFDDSDHSKGKGSDYYVKGFDVNGGLTQAVLNQEFNDNDERTEKASYTDKAKIHGTGNSNHSWNDFVLTLDAYCNTNFDSYRDTNIEVTPIYVKRAAKSTDNVRLYAQDFTGQLKENWRGTLAIYPYIESTYDPYGGYPGQLMVREGGRYVIDIPSEYVNGSGVSTPVQGLTMNNYIWDDVHYDLFFSDVSDKSNAHYQTYDFDEFEIINKIFLKNGSDEDIVFSFKYRSTTDLAGSNLASKVGDNIKKPIFYRDNKAKYDRTHVGSCYAGNGGSSIDYSKADGTYEDLDYRTLVPTLDRNDSRYEFEDLADFYGNRVDIMGNLVDVKDNEEKAAYNPIYIVSNGYDYGKVGKYATAWAYYMPMDSSGNAAWTGAVDHYGIFEVMGGQGILAGNAQSQAKFGSQSYLIDPEWSDRIIAKYTNQQGTATILDCENVPCKIAYEHEVKEDKSNYKKLIDPYLSDETGTNMAYRSDGRWYFSNSDSLITAHTAIAVVDASGKVYTRDYYQADNIDYTKGGYNKAANEGLTTGIKAYFTNDGTETVEGREISNTSGTTECNSISDGEHTFDMTTTGDPSGEYEFVGWYLYDGTNYTLASTEQTYSQEAKTNDVFVAVYRVVPSGTLNITHNLHPNSTGKADCYATVKVKDGDTVKYNSGRTDDQISVGPTYIKSNSSYYIEITLETELDQFASFDNFYNYASSAYSELVEGSDKLGLNATISIDTSSAVKTATITFPISALFDQSDGAKPQTTKAIPLFSKVSLPDYKYKINYTYPSYVSKYGNQGYTETGTFTQKQLDTYMEFVGTDLKFKTTGSLKSNFLNNNAPYEKNFKENISWNVSGTETYNTSTKTMSIDVPAIVVNKPINLTFEFPYDHANEAGKFAATETASKVAANMNGAEFVYDNTPVVDNKPKFNSNTQKFELFTFSENKSIDTVANTDLLYAPPIIWNRATPYYFRYWSVKAEGGKNNATKEYTKCYNYYFDYIIFQDSVIRPIYQPLGEGENGESITPWSELGKDDTGVQISFIENSRNQYNNGSDHTTGVSAPPYDTAADLIYSDFLLSFNSVIKENGKAIRLYKQPENTYKAGLIIERVGALDKDESGKKVVKTEAEYQTRYGINRTEIAKGKENLNTVLEKVVKGTYDSSTDGKGYLKSEIDANELDNKNRINFYYSLPNRKKTENALVLSDFLTNKNNIYRAYAYIRKSNNTEYYISEVPVYFTIYEIASIEKGGKG